MYPKVHCLVRIITFCGLVSNLSNAINKRRILLLLFMFWFLVSDIIQFLLCNSILFFFFLFLLHLGKLKNGQSITLADGTVIHPDQVLGESELSKYFIGMFFSLIYLLLVFQLVVLYISQFSPVLLFVALVVCSVQPQEENLLKQITENAELTRYILHLLQFLPSYLCF